MKPIYFCLFFILHCISLNAQRHDLDKDILSGIRLGGNYQVFEGTQNFLIPDTNDSLEVSFNQPRAGGHIGVFARFRIDPVYFQPEIHIAAANNELKLKNLNTGETEVLEERLYQVFIPVNLGVKIGLMEGRIGVRGQGGLALGLLIKGEDFNEYDTYNKIYNDAEVKYQYGLGIDIYRVVIDFNIQNRLLGSEFDRIQLYGEEQKFKYSSVRYDLTFGYIF